MPSIIFIIIIISIFIAINIYPLFFSKKAIIKRKLKKIPNKSIQDCKDEELVRIVGKVKEGAQLLNAPLSGRECAIYQVVVDEKVRKNRNTKWVELIDDKTFTDIYLEHDGHLAILDTRKVEAYLIPDQEFSSGFLKNPEPHLVDYLKKFQMTSTGLLGFNKTLRFREAILIEGDVVSVAGKVNWTTFKDPKTGELNKVLKIRYFGHTPIYMSNEPATLTLGQNTSRSKKQVIA